MIIHQDIHFPDKGGRLLLIELKQTSSELLDAFSEDERQYLNACHAFNEKRKREFLGTRLALKLIADTVNISYLKNGKPYLETKDFDLSISHSGAYVAVAVHPTSLIGVDVELNTPKIVNVYKRFLGKEEQTYLFPDAQTEKIQIAWSAKEALYKIIGNEVVDFAKGMKVIDFKLKDQGEIEAIQLNNNKSYRLYYFQTAVYTLVYCIA